MNVDYTSLEEKILDGSFRAELEAELTVGFRTIDSVPFCATMIL